ncbi:MAG: DEAD/DEAH box helicase [Legionellaceae bacterium]|nr:DEAD/DEAH box helicase [Legionellaceae bacterium]
MDKDFRGRLSFGGTSHVLAHRENWREMLALLPEAVAVQTPDRYTSPLLLNVPTILEDKNKAVHLEWWLAEESHSASVILVPYFVDGITIYRVPSFHHLVSHTALSGFDHAWVSFFSEHFCHDDAKIVLEPGDVLNAILWALARAQRLRLTSDAATLLQLGQPLQLKARLRYSEEWALWALDAELMTQTGEIITPEYLDLIVHSGLAVYDGTLFPVPTGSAWIGQLLANGAWFIAKGSLGEALFHLAHRIQDGEFFSHLPQVHCVQKSPLPVVYLRAKHFDKQAQVTLYLAYRYDEYEIFSTWHNQDETNIPIGFASHGETCIVYFRDFASESEAESLIKQDTNITFVANKRAWTVNLSTLWQLIHQLLKKRWEVWAEKHKIEELSSYGVSIESGIGWFELQSFDTQTRRLIDPLQLIKYLKRRSLFIQLGHNKICVLPERWITHLTQFLDIGQPGKHSSWCFSSIYAPEVEAVIGDEPQFEADEAFHFTVEKMRSFDKVIPLAQPDGLRAILRPYQLEGLTWLNLLCEVHVGGILADDMGLGKTVQILALLQHRFVNQPHAAPQTILVICPKSVQSHWLTQATNLVPRLPCRVLHPRDVLAGERHATQHRLLLASYGLVRHHIETLSTWHFDLLVLDEAQMIKNEFSQTTQAIKRLGATQRFALTGTPIENRFEELISIFSFLNPHAPLSLNHSSPTAEAVRDLVQRALHPFVLRRLKEDVLTDLPPKIVEKITLPMTPDQGRLYQELLAVYRNEIAKRQASHDLPTEEERAFFLEGLLRLRQVATHPQQLLGEAFQSCSSNKLIYLCDQIPLLIEKGHRIVVFSQFLGALRGLSEHMKALTIRHSYVDGQTTDREREMALFQSNTTIKVLLISLRVGGIGIDLTHTDVCILVDPWWNEAVEKQAIDRLHRFGQKKTVTVLRLISESSIEDKMELLKQNKSALADAIGKTNPDFLNHLKWNDFTEIFR